MSRIIVKNIPKVFAQKDVVEHFTKIDQITDCKLPKNSQGATRRFAFVGFKNRQTAEAVKNKYNNTYMGASKIIIDIAKTRDDEKAERSRTRQHQNSHTNAANSTQKTSKTFEKYKKVISEQVKKSWDDLVLPTNNPHFEEQQYKEEARWSSKKGNGQNEKNEQKVVAERNRQRQSASLNGQQIKAKFIKAPSISQRNKKFVTKPLQIDSNRLYITNIPYKLTEEEIKKAFSRFGNIIKIKLPKEYDGTNKGFFFLTYQKSEEALRTFAEMDNKVVFGRIIHIKPSLEDIGQMIKSGQETQYQSLMKSRYGDQVQEKSSFKKKKKREMRQKLNDTTNWNTLFLNPNTILERIAKKLHITKSQILLSDDLAPKITLAEAEVIQQTKKWMAQNGINLQFLEKDRNLCERSKKTLLIKNLNYRTQQSELRYLLSFYGIINKLLLAPNRAIALVQYQSPEFAQNTFQNIQNHKFKNNFIYLEYAPTGMIDEETLEKVIKEIQAEAVEVEELTKVVYIKNLNFQTQESDLYVIFQKMGAVKYVKIVKSKEGKSMGFGFVQFETKEQAVQCIKKLNNHLIDGHKLSLSLSRKKAQNLQEIQRLKEKIKVQEIKGNKLLVKNLAFQATKNELKELFGEYGSLKKIRVPKKMDGQHRGFAFVQFETGQQAGVAKQALSSAHLYGRKLVIEYEKGSSE